MTILLDAGFFLATERGRGDLVALCKRELSAGRTPMTHGGIVGQVWRGGPRQALLARVLHSVRVAPLDQGLGRSAGELLARAGTRDVVDAALVVLARDGDTILSSDPDDIELLVEVRGVDAEVILV